MTKVVIIAVVGLALLDIILAAGYVWSGRDLNWVTGTPLSGFSEFALLVGVFGFPAIVVGILRLVTKQRTRREIEILGQWHLSVLSGLVLFSVYLIAIRPDPGSRTAGSVREWLYDRYVGIQVPQEFKGPILASEGYEFVLEVENRTSMPMYIAKITVTRYNREAARLLGSATDVIFTHEDHRTQYLGPAEKKRLTQPGNEVLPKLVQVEVYHSLSSEPSRFEIDVGGKVVHLSDPRRLPPEATYRGLDGLVAIDKVREYTQSWGYEMHLVVAFPGDNKTFLDPATRLRSLEVETWVVTLCSPGNRHWTAIVSRDNVDLEELKSDEVCEPVPFPSLGNQEALGRCSQADLICADWKLLRIIGGKIENRWTCAWSLPYRGPNGLPLLVDATTGHRLRFSGSGESVPRFEKLELLPKAESSAFATIRADQSPGRKPAHSEDPRENTDPSPPRVSSSSALRIQRPSLGPALETKGSPVAVWQKQVMVRPPFYSGSLPLVYKEGKLPLGSYTTLITYQSFDGWRNVFVYDDKELVYSGLPSGARATDYAGRLLAEARFAILIKGEGFEIEEFHYDEKQNIQYYCKSRFDLGMGFKRSESSPTGQKAKEYFFLWPVGH